MFLIEFDLFLSSKATKLVKNLLMFLTWYLETGFEQKLITHFKSANVLPAWKPTRSMPI